MSSENEKREQARARARVILQVLTGRKTATDAAAELGVSRQTYHDWANRGMQGLLGALEDQDPGRPPLAEDPQRELLQQENLKLKRQLEVTKEIADLRGVLLRSVAEGKEPQGRSSFKKKKAESAKSSSEPNA